VWELIISLRRVELGNRPVDVLAGTGTSGFEDGPSSEAKLGCLSGVAVNPRGGVYVADWTNNRIRRIAEDGTVDTIAGSGRVGFRDGRGEEMQFSNPTAVSMLSNGDILVADTDNHAIRRITPAGDVTTLAGAPRGGGGWFKDGQVDEAMFDHPSGVTGHRDGSVMVADTDNHRVRRISASGEVTTIGGTGERGYRDGAGVQAMFSYPQGVAVDLDGNVVVSERFDNRIRLISPDGMVRTLAGSSEAGYRDGAGVDARFYRPWGIAADPDGGVLVADTYNHCIRRIARDGTVSTTFADGHPPFHYPRGISVDASGAFVVGERHRIQRVGVAEYHFV
jgi:DNA-binding beta-propeller fold protein YncE